MTRSRSPFFVRTSGAFRSACAWRSDSQLPTRTPCDRTPCLARFLGEPRDKFVEPEIVNPAC